MHEEARIAAAWWAKQLEAPAVQDNGDGLQSLCLSYSANSKTPLTAEQIDQFRKGLEFEIDRMINSGIEDGTWEPDNPNRASALRTIAVDYGPDQELRHAGDRAGIDLEFRLPCKTCMWINPGEVKVSLGYGSPIESIWINNFAKQPSN